MSEIVPDTIFPSVIQTTMVISEIVPDTICFDFSYLLVNLFGAVAMTVTALIASQWGFVFLEGVWALFSAWGLAQRIRGNAPTVVP